MVQANQHYYKPWLLLLIFNPEGGTRNYHFSTYQSNTNLNQAITLIKGSRKEKWGYYFKAESFYNVATMEEEYALERSEHYHQMSHGESFLTLIQKEFCDNGLYFLDEIEAALSPQRQLTLMAEIYRYAKRGVFLIHPFFLPCLMLISIRLMIQGFIHVHMKKRIAIRLPRCLWRIVQAY